MSKNTIVIPIYNDWKSLNKLLSQINQTLSSLDECKILIINDCSTKKIDIKKKYFNKIKQIKVLSLKMNLGSQKCISIGLDYLKRFNGNFFITIMDGDGEDSPFEIKKMLSKAKKNPNFVITSNRKNRNENFIIQFSYKLHLIISYFLTWHWISFGNFSCFNSKNLKTLNLSDVWYAYSAGVIQSCKRKKLYASRQQRYFESSKVNFLKLIEHSLRILAVFYKKIFFISFLTMFTFLMFNLKFSFLFSSFIFLFNLLIIFVKIKNYKKPSLNLSFFIKNIKILN